MGVEGSPPGGSGPNGPRPHAAQSDSGHQMHGQSFEALNTRTIDHPIEPRLDVGAVLSGLEAEVFEHHQARDEGNVGDRELLREVLLALQLMVEEVEGALDPA